MKESGPDETLKVLHKNKLRELLGTKSTNTCALNLDEEILSYALGESDNRRGGEIREHLLVCPHCFNLYFFVRAAHRNAAGLQPAKTTADFSGQMNWAAGMQLLKRLVGNICQYLPGNRHFRLSLALATSFFVAMGIFLFNNQPTPIHVDVRLFAYQGGGSRGARMESKPYLVADKGRLITGDGIKVELRAEKAAYVYGLLVENEHYASMLFFERLQPGAVRIIPEEPFRPDTDTSHALLLIVSSPVAIPDFEKIISTSTGHGIDMVQEKFPSAEVQAIYFHQERGW